MFHGEPQYWRGFHVEGENPQKEVIHIAGFDISQTKGAVLVAKCQRLNLKACLH
jgi:hypothetical protein